MLFEANQPIALKTDLVNLAHYRKADRTRSGLPDPVVVLVAYAQDELVYDNGRITTSDPSAYAAHKHSGDAQMRNILVNKFGLAYPRGWPLLMHRRLADVLIDTAIDMRNTHRLFTVVMDGLRTFEAALRMAADRPDLIASGMLATAGNSAHNRALAVDSKLFTLIDPLSYETWSGEVSLLALEEADEHGHLDDEQDMSINSRFYTGPMASAAKRNRHERLVAWQRASVKNRTPIANLLAEFWDDRVPGSPADMWRIITCRALCIGVDANPKTSPLIQNLRQELASLYEQNQQQSISRAEFAEAAHTVFSHYWAEIFPATARKQLEKLLGPGGGNPPALQDFIFHEWLTDIHDDDIAAFLLAA